MIRGAFDVFVDGFRQASPEPPDAALARIAGVEPGRARELSGRFPCAVRSAIAYDQAESLAASLVIAGARVRITPHVEPQPPRVEQALLSAAVTSIAAQVPARDETDIAFQNTDPPAAVVSDDVDLLPAMPQDRSPFSPELENALLALPDRPAVSLRVAPSASEPPQEALTPIFAPVRRVVVGAPRPRRAETKEPREAPTSVPEALPQDANASSMILSRRLLWLLAVLWVSVAMLLFTHGLF